MVVALLPGITESSGDGFGLKVGQIGPKWDKSKDFFRSDSVHFGSQIRFSNVGSGFVLF